MDRMKDPLGYARKIVTEAVDRGRLFNVTEETVDRMKVALELSDEESALILENLEYITNEVLDKLVENFWYDTVLAVASDFLVEGGTR